MSEISKIFDEIYENMTPEKKEALAAYARELRGEQSANDLYNKFVVKKDEKEEKDMKEVTEGLKQVEEAVKQLHPKEQTTLDSQLDNFLNDGVDPRVKAAKEKFLKMNAKEQAQERQKNPELYEAMFPTPKVEIPKPAMYDQMKEAIMADPSRLSRVPLAVFNYAAQSDEEFFNFMDETAKKGVPQKGANVKPLKDAQTEAQKKLEQQLKKEAELDKLFNQYGDK